RWPRDWSSDVCSSDLALSGLPNRHNFVERLQESLDGLVQTRNNGRVVVAYVDVDRFKDINDTMGHQAGDELIMAVAARLQRVLRSEERRVGKGCRCQR